MTYEDCIFMIDAATCFYDYVRIEGWFHCPGDTVLSVELTKSTNGPFPGVVGLDHPSVEMALGVDKGFRIQALTRLTSQSEVVFRMSSGRSVTGNVLDLCGERKEMFEGRALLGQFIKDATAIKGLEILDIGGRDRSGVDYSQLFGGADVTVLDIHPGENVDVVGDAHSLSNLFPPNSFDAIYSISVFEHLFMPWVVASEMAIVLRLGGLAYISTHQTLGMHDLPWDFWRFSDTAWDALFNEFTGFEIIARALDNPQYIIPHFWSPEQGDHLERAAGFVGSSVLVKKVTEPQRRWEAHEVNRIISSMYPVETKQT